MDVVDRKTRSRMMSGIRNKDTRPELLIRRGLHQAGFRYRLHGAQLPGRPDLVFPSLNAVIFINGCFWHGHRCHLFKWPSTRRHWWRDKINGTRKRDRSATRQLLNKGWRVLSIWECALKGNKRRPPEQVIAQTIRWLNGKKRVHQITGRG